MTLVCVQCVCDERVLMAKNGRELIYFQELVQTLNVCDTIHIGFHGEDYPYVLPVSFGFDIVDSQVVVYFRSKEDGFKQELIAKDPRVCVQAEILYNYFDIPREYVSCSYGSIIAYGKVEELPKEEYENAMELILTHCGYEGFTYDKGILDQSRMYKIVLKNMTGRENLKQVR